MILSAMQRASSLKGVWLNDADPEIYGIWNSVWQKPDLLCDELARLTPSVALFREILSSDHGSSVQHAARRIALQQWSFSGLGRRAGGPIGGWTQQGKYKIDCRWNPGALRRKISAISHYLDALTVKVSNDDAAEVIGRSGGWDLYVDPPYFLQGESLYTEKVSHEALCNALAEKSEMWILSYDDHPEIRNMYSFAHTSEIELSYTINSRAGNRKTELLISGQELEQQQKGLFND